MKISTEAEYNAALDRMDTIFSAEVGTPENAEAEALAAAIEDYEKINLPLPEITALQYIAERMHQQGVTLAEFAETLKSTPGIAKALLSGTRPIDAATAVAIAELLCIEGGRSLVTPAVRTAA
ncbi:hypothetical protein DB346_10725 [Verrucomicrobia bacterium LW23]|nr:hypothetical protein DB346_10725 [Verrucomicrobia bacterium LW23]